MQVGIVGASGYAGGELLRLLTAHPEFNPSYIAAGSSAGEKISSVHPHLVAYKGKEFAATEVAALSECELVFLALPHGESAALVKQLSSDIKVIDLGADFRLSSEKNWKKYYGGNHAGSWTYGLPELPGQRARIQASTRIANPGCYATAISLGLAPVIKSKLIDQSDVVVVAASGTTGAGRTTKSSLSASEVMNSLTSYKFGGVHQHTPEIEEALSAISDAPVNVSFTPILAPMPRGILATITAKTESTDEAIRKIYHDSYDSEHFINVLARGEMPATSAVTASNGVQIQLAVDQHASRLILSVAIDNLGKGAAGQAIQNANLICGFDEGLALTSMGVGR